MTEPAKDFNRCERIRGLGVRWGKKGSVLHSIYTYPSTKGEGMSKSDTLLSNLVEDNFAFSKTRSNKQPEEHNKGLQHRIRG